MMSRHRFNLCALVLLCSACPSDDDGGAEGTTGPGTTSPSTSSTGATSTGPTTTDATTSSESGEPSTTSPEGSSTATTEPDTSSSSTAGSDLVWLQNDSFTPADSIQWEQWPGAGDCWASMYDIDNTLYPFDIVELEVAIGGGDGTQTFEVGVWTVDGNNGPMDPIDTAMVDIEGATDFTHIDVEAMLDVPTIENGTFAVVMCHTDHMGSPSIATDADATVDAQNNWAYQAAMDEWVQAPDFFRGITGDFILRTGVRPAA